MKLSLMILTGWALFFLTTAIGIYPNLSKSAEGDDNQCIACHTGLNKLIRLCWEVEALKPKPLKSEETSGEG